MRTHCLAYCLLLSLASLPRQAVPDEVSALPEFMAGCWRGELDNGEVISEQYSSPAAGVILGTVVSTKDGKVTFFEFIRVHVEDNRVIYQPYPNGIAANVVFTLTEREFDKASFENPDHDFPQQVSYRLLADGKLLTRVAGTVKGRYLVNEYATVRVPCAGN